jgi:Uma2 family endonuclease
MDMTTAESTLANPQTVPATDQAAIEPQAAPTARRVFEGEQRVILRGIDWEGYEAILKAIGDQAAVRLAYDQGDLELMSPSIDHDAFKKRLGRLVETLTLELDIPCESLGSPTWRKALKQKGIEPDECFYIANSAKVAGRFDIDLNVDPPPDLAIEIEISRSAVDRLGIYAALGIPEIWRFNGQTLVVEVLQPDGSYAAQPISPSLPFMPLERLVDWVHAAEGVNQTTWIRRFRDWVLEEFGPRNV